VKLRRAPRWARGARPSINLTVLRLERRTLLAENIGLTMANPNMSARPAWQRNELFRFFASLKLAVVLLAVLIVAAITGTIYESTFDAKVARAYIYGAPWFNAWLVLLGANLTVSALSRWPWKKHHLAFLVTHLGIITLLTGSLIGRMWGVEGTVTLFKGDPPTNRLLIDQHQLRVRDIDGAVKGYPAEFLHRPPTPDHPRDLGPLASGARLSVIDYAPAIEATLNPRPLSEGGIPALHFAIDTAMMGQHLESWLLADDAQHGNFSMGLANIEMKRGIAPGIGHDNSAHPADKTESTNPGENANANPSDTNAEKGIDLEESIFAFSKAPEEQIGRVQKGGSTGAKIRLLTPQNGNKGRLSISLGGQQTSLDVGESLGKTIGIPGTDFSLRIDNYWPDFRIEGGKPSSLSDQPNNPAVLITIRGKGIPVQTAPSAHGGGPEFNANGGPPAMPPSDGEAVNHLTLFFGSDGAITYQLISRKAGPSSGKLDLNQPLTTGWADWQLKIDKVMPHAEQWFDFDPVKSASSPSMAELPDGVRIRVQQNGETIEQWVPAGWQVTVPTSPQETQFAYGWKLLSLPIGLELLDFEVKRNEGTDSPAGFKSTLGVSTVDGDLATGQCWMNHPFSYPGAWWRTWTGLTFKISQASWNPENLGQSTVQILRDPGWLFKWIGSLLIVAGVFMMFYLRPYRKQTVGQPILPSAPKLQKPVRPKSSIRETVAH
jgi:hypothetical protein